MVEVLETDMPFVSVVIPCYNREHTVRQALDSVLSQDYPNFEVVLVDDSSTDGTLDVLNSIKDPRVSVLINTGPRGAGSNRNHGWRNSRGEWVAFQDSDDLWRPGKLRKQMAALLRDDRAVACYCGMVIKADANPDSPVIERLPGAGVTHKSGDVLPSLIRSSFISTQTLVVRRDILDQTGGFDISLPAIEDWELMIRVAEHGPVIFVDEDLVEQRFSENSLTKFIKKRIISQEMILKKHSDLISQYPGVLALHHARISGAQRDSKQYAEAQKHAVQAFWLDRSAKRLFALVYVICMRIVAKFSQK